MSIFAKLTCKGNFSMLEKMISLLRCPVTRSPLHLQVIATSSRSYNDSPGPVIETGILFAEKDWFYPVIDGIPRLLVEAFQEYASFFEQHLPDYRRRRDHLEYNYRRLIRYIVKKNAQTRKSFSQEWSIFEYGSTRTWGTSDEALLQRFLTETAETTASLKGKIIFDAGCGHGLLNRFVAASGATILGMDFSDSVVRAYKENDQGNAWFIQGDVQFPPVAFQQFDIVHCSGVLIHTHNPELSFSCIEPCVKPGGKLSVWLYHPRKDAIHNILNFIRRFSSRLPLRLQYWLYTLTIFPVTFVVKRFKGNKETPREMMVYILDWFTPQFRWEIDPLEAATWFSKRNYSKVQKTTSDTFGFNITGVKTAAV